jgi:hypothetical protein
MTTTVRVKEKLKSDFSCFWFFDFASVDETWVGINGIAVGGKSIALIWRNLQWFF